MAIIALVIKGSSVGSICKLLVPSIKLFILMSVFKIEILSGPNKDQFYLLFAFHVGSALSKVLLDKNIDNKFFGLIQSYVEPAAKLVVNKKQSHSSEFSSQELANHMMFFSLIEDENLKQNYVDLLCYSFIISNPLTANSFAFVETFEGPSKHEVVKAGFMYFCNKFVESKTLTDVPALKDYLNFLVAKNYVSAAEKLEFENILDL
jgi:hypothetical protein